MLQGRSEEYDCWQQFPTQSRLWKMLSVALGERVTKNNFRAALIRWRSRDPVLVSSSDDRTIRFWNIETGECLKILRSDRPYEGMNVTGVVGITEAQRTTLKALGAIERVG